MVRILQGNSITNSEARVACRMATGQEQIVSTWTTKPMSYVRRGSNVSVDVGIRYGIMDEEPGPRSGVPAGCRFQREQTV